MRSICTMKNRMSNHFNFLSLLVLSVVAVGLVVAGVRPRPEEKEITFKISAPLEFKGVLSRVHCDRQISQTFSICQFVMATQTSRKVTAWK
jgi:hypothetical protein